MVGGGAAGEATEKELVEGLAIGLRELTGRVGGEGIKRRRGRGGGGKSVVISRMEGGEGVQSGLGGLGELGRVGASHSTRELALVNESKHIQS